LNGGGDQSFLIFRDERFDLPKQPVDIVAKVAKKGGHVAKQPIEIGLKIH
jgi:hypothetical protein